MSKPCSICFEIQQVDQSVWKREEDDPANQPGCHRIYGDSWVGLLVEHKLTRIAKNPHWLFPVLFISLLYAITPFNLPCVTLPSLVRLVLPKLQELRSRSSLAIAPRIENPSSSMLCNVCRDGLEGIWDPSKTKRVCSWEEWSRNEADAAESQEEAETGTFNPQTPWISTSDSITVPLEALEPQKCMFGHHVTKESFLQAFKDGCVMCNRFDRDGSRNPKIEQRGYYSLFSVHLQVNEVVMYMYVNNYQGGFSLFPYVGMSLSYFSTMV